MAVKRVRVGDDLFDLARRKVDVQLDGTYREIGVRSFSRGVFHKDPIAGVDLGNKRVFEIHPGDLVVSNVFAWEGAVAVAGEQEAGMIGSHRFMTWVPNRARVDVRYANHYFASSSGLTALQRASPGSAGRNKTLGITAFENLEIPLPDLDEQRAIADRLDRAVNSADAIRSSTAARPDLMAMVPQLIDTAFSDAAVPMTAAGDLYEAVSDVVQRDEDPGDATRFVGLEHIESHSGVRRGSSGIEDRRGRKLRFCAGDVIFGYLRPYLNKVWAADGAGLCSVEQYVLRPSNGVDPELLSASLRSATTLQAAKAATHHLQLPRLRSGLLAAIEVPDARKAPEGLLRSISTLTDKARRLDRLFRHQDALVKSFAASARNEVFASL